MPDNLNTISAVAYKDVDGSADYCKVGTNNVIGIGRAEVMRQPMIRVYYDDGTGEDILINFRHVISLTIQS